MTRDYQPRHRRCTRPRHHVWGDGRRTLTGWGVVRCTMCGQVELFI